MLDDVRLDVRHTNRTETEQDGQAETDVLLSGLVRGREPREERGGLLKGWGPKEEGGGLVRGWGPKEEVLGLVSGWGPKVEGGGLLKDWGPRAEVLGLVRGWGPRVMGGGLEGPGLVRSRELRQRLSPGGRMWDGRRSVMLALRP